MARPTAKSQNSKAWLGKSLVLCKYLNRLEFHIFSGRFQPCLQRIVTKSPGMEMGNQRFLTFQVLSTEVHPSACRCLSKGRQHAYANRPKALIGQSRFLLVVWEKSLRLILRWEVKVKHCPMQAQRTKPRSTVWQ